MPIQILNAKGHNKIGQNRPKPGRLATASYGKWGAKRIVGPDTQALGTRPDYLDHAVVDFGKTSRAGVATQFGQDRTETGGPNPLGGNFNVNTIPKLPPLVNGGANEGNKPRSPAKAILIMPHERPVIGANNYRNLNKRAHYRTNMGAGRAMVSDTAFHRTERIKQPKVKAQPAHEAVKVPRAAQPSYVIHKGQQWYDPNNSFNQGAPNATGNGTGVGRWQIVKRGAAG